MLIQGKLERTETNLTHYKWGSVWIVHLLKTCQEIRTLTDRKKYFRRLKNFSQIYLKSRFYDHELPLNTWVIQLVWDSAGGKSNWKTEKLELIHPTKNFMQND